MRCLSHTGNGFDAFSIAEDSYPLCSLAWGRVYWGNSPGTTVSGMLTSLLYWFGFPGGRVIASTGCRGALFGARTLQLAST